MTPRATELVQVSDGLHLWQVYDSSAKVDLFSTALETESGVFIIDPAPLRDEIVEEFVAGRTLAGIFVTNANHCRASIEFAQKFRAQIIGHKATCAACPFSASREIEDGESIAQHTCAIQIEGAPAGEMAIYHGDHGGTLIIGDALINFDPHGFTFLPPKYCINAKQMRRSLRRLLDYRFERILFAHGTPLIHSARRKLEALLENSD